MTTSLKSYGKKYKRERIVKMFNNDNSTRADGRIVAANPSPNPPPSEVTNKPPPPFRVGMFSDRAGGSAPEPKFIPPMPNINPFIHNESCKYCDVSNEETAFIVSGYVCEDRKDNISVSAFIHRDTMIFSANFITLETTINFCPMCGRKLTSASDCDWTRDAN